MKDPLKPGIFKIVSRQAAARNVRAYVIGGYVRDHFLKRPCTDIDIVVEGNGMELASDVASVLKVNATLFKNFGTAMLRYRGLEIEFVGARKESYSTDSRKPVVENGTVEDDQKRRDLLLTLWHSACSRRITDPLPTRSMGLMICMIRLYVLL